MYSHVRAHECGEGVGQQCARGRKARWRSLLWVEGSSESESRKERPHQTSWRCSREALVCVSVAAGCIGMQRRWRVTSRRCCALCTRLAIIVECSKVCEHQRSAWDGGEISSGYARTRRLRLAAASHEACSTLVPFEKPPKLCRAGPILPSLANGKRQRTAAGLCRADLRARRS